MERLKLLLVLTVCDIRAVGPGVWNGWKGQLLRTLYYETEPILTGGFSATLARPAARGGARDARRAGLPTGRRRSASATSTCTIPAYWLRVDEDRQVRHAAFVRDADARRAGLRLRGAADGVRGRRRRSPSSRPTIRGCSR